MTSTGLYDLLFGGYLRAERAACVLRRVRASRACDTLAAIVRGNAVWWAWCGVLAHAEQVCRRAAPLLAVLSIASHA